VAGGGERTLTQRELNRALLARQLLLERSRLPLPRVLERIGGIQNQYAPNAYIRLCSCLEGFDREDLTRALGRRTAIQATLMRGTIHVVSKRDFWPLATAIRATQQEWWRRVNGVPEDVDLAPLVERMRGFLRARTRTRAEITEFERANGFPAPGSWGFANHAELVRVPPSGTWERRRAGTFALAEDWVGAPDCSVEDATEHLVRRYLGAFGPAARDDIASWAHLPPARVAPTLERMTLRRFRDEAGRELLDLPRAPLPDPDLPAPPRFLPTWDAVLLAHARRTGVLPERYKPVVFHPRNPPSVPTFLVDGIVAGAWRHDGGRIELEPFERLDRGVLRRLREEAERLGDLHA